MILTKVKDNFPAEEFLGGCFDQHSTKVGFNGIPVQMILQDTKGNIEDHAACETMLSPDCIPIVCFDVLQEASFYNARDFWLPLVKQNCGQTPFILLGTKMDLRDNKLYRAKSKTTPEQGEALAKQFGAVRYTECSAHTKEGLPELFRQVVDIMFNKL